MKFPELLEPLDIAAYEHAHKVVNSWPIESLELEPDACSPSQRSRVPTRHIFDIIRAVVDYVEADPDEQNQEIMANHMALVAMERVAEHEGPRFSQASYTQQLLSYASFIDSNTFRDLAPETVRVASVRVRAAVLALFLDTIELPETGFEL